METAVPRIRLNNRVSDDAVERSTLRQSRSPSPSPVSSSVTVTSSKDVHPDTDDSDYAPRRKRKLAPANRTNGLTTSCDACTRRRVRCSPEVPCPRCAKLGIPCTRLRKVKKRGPRPKSDPTPQSLVVADAVAQMELFARIKHIEDEARGRKRLSAKNEQNEQPFPPFGEIDDDEVMSDRVDITDSSSKGSTGLLVPIPEPRRGHERCPTPAAEAEESESLSIQQPPKRPRKSARPLKIPVPSKPTEDRQRRPGTMTKRTHSHSRSDSPSSTFSASPDCPPPDDSVAPFASSKEWLLPQSSGDVLDGLWSERGPATAAEYERTNWKRDDEALPRMDGMSVLSMVAAALDDIGGQGEANIEGEPFQPNEELDESVFIGESLGLPPRVGVQVHPNLPPVATDINDTSIPPFPPFSPFQMSDIQGVTGEISEASGLNDTPRKRLDAAFSSYFSLPPLNGAHELEPTSPSYFMQNSGNRLNVFNHSHTAATPSLEYPASSRFALLRDDERRRFAHGLKDMGVYLPQRTPGTPLEIG
ncbi:hypothetical protein M427DRAFT_138283 [Gonapodya prolifera JEL478]|uniref:Zn(2)-C6 fungal-type domain-containing protein n=1 Tax=Gonapodya prolifera (strain JEL478) TaxID=1344416 RepID=A0A139A3I0_GONPJ|nr:hypothetical protein M427DRAFT_138283 [Gonapodya prolifera JEL478]|eukprot:KXS11330.1 hypothetical protein M427DRAFT_138283 [Gonapodya prolifera JEL478]